MYNYKRAEGEWFRLENDEVVHFLETCEQQDNIIQMMKDNIFFSKNLK